jgi:2-keto-4-pentenoate hydratase/2-oxohepta-3-ene-1,7-dioic acid hydratase in catechol pathway
VRLLMFDGGQGPRPGVLQGGDRVIDLLASARARGEELPTDLLGLVDAGPEAWERVGALIDGVKSRPLAEVKLLPPLNPRGNVLCIGRNYLEHAKESARARGEEVDRPTVFTKAQTAVIGPWDDVSVDSRITTQVDWEVELGVVIGRGGKDISEERALDHVFGYLVVNDLSARDVQFGWGGQFFKGKSLDGFCPIGPWIVTADEIPDPQNLRLTLSVNGTVKQNSNTRDMIFAVAELIAQLSLGMTLRAGSLIATGTPEGVGMGRNPQEYLRDGDVAEAAVDGIGSLRNRIVVKSVDAAKGSGRAPHGQ